MYRRSFATGNSWGGELSPAIKWLLVANGGMYLLQQLFPPLTSLLGLVPWKIVHEVAIYQFVTYLFLHGGFFHILFNMLMLWMFGRELEATWGTRYFLKYYFFTGIGAGVISFLFDPSSMAVTIGASGAIMALLVGFAVLNPNRTVYVYMLFPVKIKYLVMFLIAIDLFGAVGPADGVARMAHLGGALIGFVYLKADWRLSQWGKKVKNYRYDRKVNKIRKERQVGAQDWEEVDRVLDRINEVGYDGLTRDEKRILENASELLSRKHNS
jgi:membrane associated rhomboid family serine protease